MLPDFCTSCRCSWRGIIRKVSGEELSFHLASCGRIRPFHGHLTSKKPLHSLFYLISSSLAAFMLTEPCISEAKPREDQSTFLGRLKHFLRITDPRTLLISDEELEKSKSMLDNYKKTKQIPAEGVEALWTAQNSTFAPIHSPSKRSICSPSLFIVFPDVNAIIHPTTGEKIFAPFRMSAFVPANVLIAAGLLIPGAGVRS